MWHFTIWFVTFGNDIINSILRLLFFSKNKLGKDIPLNNYMLRWQLCLYFEWAKFWSRTYIDFYDVLMRNFDTLGKTIDQLLCKAGKQVNFCELVIFGYTHFTEVLVLFHFVLNIDDNLSVLFQKDTSTLCIMCIKKSKSFYPVSLSMFISEHLWIFGDR